MTTQTRIVVIEPNGVQRTMPLTPRGLTIGRGSDNNLVINYPTTSRHHARITFENGFYHVVDLGSDNGTLLANSRLTPNQPTFWEMGLPLSIGEVVIKLEQAAHALPRGPVQREAVRGREDTATIAGMMSPLRVEKKESGAGRIVASILMIVAVLCGLGLMVAAVGYVYLSNG